MRNFLYFLILLFPFTLFSQEEGYTQGAGLTYQVNFNTLSELLQKIGLKKKKKKKIIKKKDTVKVKKKSLINFKQ